MHVRAVCSKIANCIHADTLEASGFATSPELHSSTLNGPSQGRYLRIGTVPLKTPPSSVEELPSSVLASSSGTNGGPWLGIVAPFCTAVPDYRVANFHRQELPDIDGSQTLAKWNAGPVLDVSIPAGITRVGSTALSQVKTFRADRLSNCCCISATYTVLGSWLREYD